MMLVVLGLLPLLALAIYSAYSQRKAAAKRAKAEALRVARLCADFDDHRVESARQLLVTLAQLPAVGARDARYCNTLFTRILREYPVYLDVCAADPQGRIFARGSTSGVAADLTLPDVLREAVEQKQITIRPYQRGDSSPSAMMTVVYPVFDEGGDEKAVICVVLDLGWLDGFVRDAQLPKGSLLLAYTASQVVLASSPRSEEWEGKSVADTEIGRLVRQLLASGRQEGTVQGMDLDAVERITAFTKAHFSHSPNQIYFHVGLPAAQAFQEANRALKHQVILLCSLAAIALTMAWLFAGWLVLGPVKALVKTTKEIAQGNLSARSTVDLHGGELQQLSTAFDEMAASLEQRTSEQRAAEAALRRARDELEVRVQQRTAELAASNEGLQKEMAEREKIQEELRLSKERLELVIQGTNDGVWDWDVKTNEVYFSPRWKSMLGYEDHEISNRFDEWERRLHPDDRVMALARVRAYLAGDIPVYELEHRLLHKDGHYRWILARGLALRDEDGKPYRMAGSHTDLTERKHAAEELKKAAEELARSNKELEQFAYIASHDLQEPLRMVSSYTELLARRYKDKLDNDAREFIGYAVDGARRMGTLINDLLAYSRVSSQKKPYELVDCMQTMKAVRDNLKMVIDESGAKVIAEALPRVMGDPTQLLQLLQNLIGNAIKFRGSQPPIIEVAAVERDGEWLFSVKDNGIGIDPEDFERIFLVFQRLHTREEYPGTGIGLALCKRIVERHGGHLWVESAKGKGSTFYFTIPKRSSEIA
jgi:PAS domain S-box-containing protein